MKASELIAALQALSPAQQELEVVFSADGVLVPTAQPILVWRSKFSAFQYMKPNENAEAVIRL